MTDNEETVSDSDELRRIMLCVLIAGFLAGGIWVAALGLGATHPLGYLFFIPGFCIYASACAWIRRVTS